MKSVTLALLSLLAFAHSASVLPIDSSSSSINVKNSGQDYSYTIRENHGVAIEPIHLPIHQLPIAKLAPSENNLIQSQHAVTSQVHHQHLPQYIPPHLSQSFSQHVIPHLPPQSIQRHQDIQPQQDHQINPIEPIKDQAEEAAIHLPVAPVAPILPGYGFVPDYQYAVPYPHAVNNYPYNLIRAVI